ncbi:MAG: hypothetical protein ACD_19C00176G0026 [uncultured bacterium]|nr:MAG: hypothetical protein ACD_19C00176G0026 [uncultured bacterium]
MSRTENGIPHFLADTWWYGMTNRVSDQRFEEMARLRVKQGFTAVQIVVGMPPEIGSENVNAPKLDGKYLDHSKEKIEFLNSLGLTAIIYGAWGHQIELIGEKRMKNWWTSIVKTMNNLDVMYCITGESDIWIGEEKKLLPDKSTDELDVVRLLPFLHPRIVYMGKRMINILNNQFNESKKSRRHKKWSNVLSVVSDLTSKPILIHVLPNMTSHEAVNNPQLLDAITVQTGHSIETKQLLWKLSLENIKNNPNTKFINLEPWYEGINDSFGKEDQLYAYWVSMMAGAHAYCYGAHGIWNAGDGKFLSHWGKQTLDEALQLNTPELIGKSHKLFVNYNFFDYPNIQVEEEKGELIKITRSNDNGDSITYFPEASKADTYSRGKVFLPTRGIFVKNLPKNGQIVIISSKL